LLIFKRQRERYPNNCASPVLNILEKGEQKLRSASLKTFNNKVHGLMNGQCDDDEVDDIPQADYADILVNDEDMQGPEDEE
jgi:hypothetical protein